MTKQFFPILLATLALGACSSDDNTSGLIDDKNLPDLTDGSLDLANGRSVVIVDADDIESYRLLLGTKRNVTAGVPDGFPLKVEVVTAADTTRYLSFSHKGDLAAMDAPAVYDLTLELVSDPTVKKELKLVVRPHGSSPTDVNEYAYNIGKGTKVWSELGNVTYPVMDFSQIESHLSDNVNNVQTGVEFEIGGERYEETMERVCQKVGLGALGRGGGYALTGSTTFSQEASTKNIQNTEFYLGYYSKVMAEVKLNPDWIENIKAKGELFSLLDETTNDAMNNPGSGAYKQYANDKEGVKKFLDHYGTHVITQGAFGGNYIYIYARRENAYENSVGHDASANITLRYNGTDKATTWLQQYQRKHSSPYINPSVDASDYTAEYQDVSHYYEMVKATGGDADTDIASWEEKFSSESPSKWVVVSYATLDSEGKGNLLPILDFIVDPERRAAVDKYFEDYLREKVQPLVEEKIVLADFMMKAGSDGHKHGDPKSFISTGPDGKKYLYMPVMASLAHEYPTQAGYALETNQDKYVVGTTTKGHYWYYALGYDSECAGFSKMRFDNKSHDGWVKRGDNANHGVTGALDDNYVQLYVKDSGRLKYEEKIKAAIITYVNNHDIHWYGSYLGTAGGAEMQMPFDSQVSKDNFESYWSKSVNFPSEHNYDYPFYDGWLQTPNQFCLGYSFKELPVKKLSFGEGNTKSPIQHPHKWGEQL